MQLQLPTRAWVSLCDGRRLCMGGGSSTGVEEVAQTIVLFLFLLLLLLLLLLYDLLALVVTGLGEVAWDLLHIGHIPLEGGHSLP